jgi:hypothetical protein
MVAARRRATGAENRTRRTGWLVRTASAWPAAEAAAPLLTCAQAADREGRRGAIAKAKVEVSASLTSSVGITVGHTYTHSIHSGKYGHMQYGSWGQQVTWTKYKNNASCTTTLAASGTARIPSSTVGSKFWETSS